MELNTSRLLSPNNQSPSNPIGLIKQNLSFNLSDIISKVFCGFDNVWSIDVFVILVIGSSNLQFFFDKSIKIHICKIHFSINKIILNEFVLKLIHCTLYF